MYMVTHFRSMSQEWDTQGISNLRKLFLVALALACSLLQASCPTTTPWSTPVNLSISGDATSNIFSAATANGFMSVWADAANNAHYSFSKDGVSWNSGLVSSAQGNVASVSDVFVAGNNQGFLVAWMDSLNNAWSSFTINNGVSWSTAIQINPNALPLNPNSDVFVKWWIGRFCCYND